MFDFNRHQLVAACIVVGLALIGTVTLVTRSVIGRPGGIRFIDPTGPGVVSADTPSISIASVPRTVRIHVVGQVSSPGLYDLKPGSRVEDAIKAAGGAAPNADLISINLASPLSDGQQVYVAQKGKVPLPTKSVIRGSNSRPQEETSAKAGAAGGPPAPVKLTKPGEGTVNINTADKEKLQRLPGIGPAMAQRILDYRTQNGSFRSIEELDEVKGIGPATLTKVRPFVSL